jgi:biopolymer transport protein ExbD
MNFRKRSAPQLPGFQLAPMIDVIFLLLAFFVTTQIFSQWETDLNIKLPSAHAGETPNRLSGEIIVNIHRDGTFLVNQRQLSAEDLSALLARIVKLFPGESVLIRADRSTPYEYIIQVLDICRGLDIWNLSFATIPEEE